MPKKATKKPKRKRGKTFESYFKDFEKKCPIYTGRYKDFDKKCLEACHSLVEAKKRTEDYKYGLTVTIMNCSGKRGEKCGDALNRYENLKEKIENE
ncbi:MAG: hypothetical protein ACE5J7_04720 [Candidatus Aenigmatarchaeota archaeon]